MDNLPSPTAVVIEGMVMLLSAGLCVQLIKKLRRGRPLIPYEPRRPVPWNALAPLVILAPLALSLQAAVSTAPPPPIPPPELAVSFAAQTAAAAGEPPAAAIAAALSSQAARQPSTDASITRGLWIEAIFKLGLGIGCYAILAVGFGATASDLGLPTSWRQFGSDAYLGAAVWLASMAPIHLTMFVLSIIFQPTSQHPLIDQLISEHSLGVMFAAACAAVVAAPVYEETAFRLIFQGWLERRDMLDRPVQAYDPPPAPTERNEVFDPQRDLLPSDAPPAARSTYTCAAPTWLPVVVSGVTFGLAHYGHGVAPVPLMLLGAMLGYVYRQTHRVMPCIVCHALFNGFTFVLLSLQFAA